MQRYAALRQKRDESVSSLVEGGPAFSVSWRLITSGQIYTQALILWRDDS